MYLQLLAALMTVKIIEYGVAFMYVWYTQRKQDTEINNIMNQLKSFGTENDSGLLNSKDYLQ